MTIDGTEEIDDDNYKLSVRIREVTDQRDALLRAARLVEQHAYSAYLPVSVMADLGRAIMAVSDTEKEEFKYQRKHAPGPWELRGGNGCQIIVAPKLTPQLDNRYPWWNPPVPEIASTAQGKFDDFGEMNARLMVKSPEMLDLLIEWRTTPFFDKREEWNRWVNSYGARVDQVIAQATGTK